jgi:hypothetical protein
MADEAFALSPISARPVQPGEADYDAIKEAFMETSRGRWFLGEYAKRNRNADTKMVLDAVARIEETISSQKKPERDPLLDEALASLRTALGEAREAASAAIGDLALEQNLAPVRKGARVIREIAWRLREIGADSRICDLIDSQVAAIDGAATKLSPADLANALSGAFDRIEGKIAAFDAEDAAPSSSPAAEVSPPPDLGKALDAETAVVNGAIADEPAIAAVTEAAGEPVDAFDAGDEAMLDMVALEMGAPDTDAAYEPSIEELEAYETETEAAQFGETQVQARQAGKTQDGAGSWEIEVSFGSDAGDRAAEPAMAAALPAVTPLQPAPEPVAESSPSLGSSLIANGIVPRPRTSRPDPLAPIRRMTQTEKIAFFS